MGHLAVIKDNILQQRQKNNLHRGSIRYMCIGMVHKGFHGDSQALYQRF